MLFRSNYTITGTSAAGACTNTQTTSITVNSIPSVTVTAATICSGSSGTLTASGAASYTWNTGPTTPNIVVSPIVNTTYTVVGANGPCTNTQTTSIIVNALPGVTVTPAITNDCTSGTGGSTIALTGSPAGGVYSGVGVVGSTFNPQAAAGVYTVSYLYTNTVTACSNSAASTITISLCLGVAQLSVNYTENIYVVPNPNNGKFTVNADIADAYDVTVYNSIGQMIQFIPQNKSTLSVDLSKYGKGMYNLLFKIGDKYKTVKVVVE